MHSKMKLNKPAAPQQTQVIMERNMRNTIRETVQVVFFVIQLIIKANKKCISYSKTMIKRGLLVLVMIYQCENAP